MNQGFGKDLYRKGNSVKRSGDSLNRRTLKTEKLLSSSPSTENQFLKNGRKTNFIKNPSTFSTNQIKFFHCCNPGSWGTKLCVL